jgi:rhodanese-related sulfurtransferase
MSRPPTARVALLLSALLGVGCERSPAAHAIDGAGAHRLVAAGATLLDVRTPEEFAGGHVEGARNVPVDELTAGLASVPRGRPVVVYCASGMRSARAAAELARAGFDARDLGGIDAWGR